MVVRHVRAGESAFAGMQGTIPGLWTMKLHPRPVRVEERCRLRADDTSAKRQRLMAGMPTLHQTDENFKKYYGAKSGNLLDTLKVYEGRLRELANIEKLEVAEPRLSTGSGWTM